MSVLKLPNELLGHILELCRPYAFEAFALSCKRLHSIAEVSLPAHNELRRRFRRFSFMHSLKYTNSSRSPEEHTFFVLQFLLEIAAEPIIPAYIVYADLGTRNYVSDFTAGGGDLPHSIAPKLRGEHVKQKLRKLLEGSNHLRMIGANIGEWTSAIYEDTNQYGESCDYATAFLLSLLTNVESLTLHEQWNMRSVQLGRQTDDQMDQGSNEVAKLVHLLVTQANERGGHQPLQKLTHLRPSQDVDSQSGIETLTIFPFLALKTVESAEHQYGKYEIWNDTVSLSGYPVIGSGLKTLELFDYVVDKEAGNILFHNMKNLRVFRLKYVMLDEIGGDWSAGTFVQQLIDAVGSHLEVLSINVGMLWSNEDPIVSLEGLTALRELDLDVQLFYRWQFNEEQGSEAMNEDQEDNDEMNSDNEDEDEDEEDEDSADGEDDEGLSLLEMLPETAPDLKKMTLRCLPVLADHKRLQDLFEGFVEGRERQLPALELVRIIFGDKTSTLREWSEDKETIQRGILHFDEMDGVEVEELS